MQCVRWGHGPWGPGRVGVAVALQAEPSGSPYPSGCLWPVFPASPPLHWRITPFSPPPPTVCPGPRALAAFCFTRGLEPTCPGSRGGCCVDVTTMRVTRGALPSPLPPSPRTPSPSGLPVVLYLCVLFFCLGTWCCFFRSCLLAQLGLGGP